MANSSKKLKEVTSLAELRDNARNNPAYARLLSDGAENIGGPASPDSLTEQSVRRSFEHLLGAAEEIGEDAVLDEVNFLIEDE